MTDDKIIEAVARAIYDADEPAKLLSWDKRDDVIKDRFYIRARAAWKVAKSALAAEGFVIHRFHLWTDDPGPHGLIIPRPYCGCCGLVQGGIEDAASCPGEVIEK